MKRRRWTDEAISAYLDGAMSERERRAFEAALAADPALRRRLEAMQEVVALVAAMPMRKAPRSYRLTPEMVARPKRKAPLLTPAFSRVAVLAALLLTVAWFVLLRPTSTMRQAAAPPPTTLSYAETNAESAEATRAPTSDEDEGAAVMGASAITTEMPMAPAAEEATEITPPKSAQTPLPALTPTPAPSSPAPTSGGRLWLLGGAGLLLLLLGGAVLLRRHRRKWKL